MNERSEIRSKKHEDNPWIRSVAHDLERSLSQVYPNVPLKYVGLRRPITSSFHKRITVEFLIVMNKCPNISCCQN